MDNNYLSKYPTCWVLPCSRKSTQAASGSEVGQPVIVALSEFIINLLEDMYCRSAVIKLVGVSFEILFFKRINTRFFGWHSQKVATC
jgi:hypothetical protein